MSRTKTTTENVCTKRFPSQPGRRMSAQAWSLDFIISSVIFFFVIVLVISAWNYTSTQSAEQLDFNEAESTALTVSDSIIRTQGIPTDWNTSNVRSIGLADEANILNDTKLLRFASLSYQTSRVLLTGEFNFYFELRQLDNKLVAINGTNITAGMQPLNPRIIVPVDRYVLHQRRPAKIRLVVWA